MLDHPHQNHSINLQQAFMLICRQKIKSKNQRKSKLVILGNLIMSRHTHLKQQYHFEETFDIYLQAKSQLHPPCFLERYVNLLWIIWACLITNQNNSTNLQKTLTFIRMKKLNFIIHFFLEILHFRNPAILLADSILALNLRPRNWRDMGLVVKYQ